MRWPRPRFSIRSMMILVAIVAIAPVAAVKVYDCLERRERYLAQAETCANVAAEYRRKAIQSEQMADAWDEQGKKGLPDDLGIPGVPRTSRQERIAQYRNLARMDRLGMEIQLELEQKLRCGADRPWKKLEGQRR